MIGRLLMSTVLAFACLCSSNQVVPAAFLGMAGAPVLSVLDYCAELSLSCGAEIREADAVPVPGHIADLSGDKTVPLSAFANSFNSDHTRYQASLIGGVLVIRPVDVRSGYLDSDAQLGMVRVRGLMSGAERLFSPLNAKLAVPHGRIGSFPGPVGINVDRGEDIELNINGAGKTVVEVLNDIAAQAPGHPWMVVTSGGNKPKIVRFGFVHRYGTSTEESIPCCDGRP